MDLGLFKIGGYLELGLFKIKGVIHIYIYIFYGCVSLLAPECAVCLCLWVEYQIM